MSDSETDGNSSARVYVTLSGLPLQIELRWPFHKSVSGADFWVLHGDVRLANSDGLHAPVAVNVSATVREVLPSLDPQHAEAPVINALRKEVDKRQLEFVRSGKLVPVHFSSRYYDFNRSKWMFGKASDADITTLLVRKVFWHTRLVGGKVWVGDPTEALYLENAVPYLLQVAGELEKSGLMTIDGEWGAATEPLMAQATKFGDEMRHAQANLEKKHAFEDARKAG
jgi:hypothetical protein